MLLFILFFVVDANFVVVDANFVVVDANVVVVVFFCCCYFAENHRTTEYNTNTNIVA